MSFSLRSLSLSVKTTLLTIGALLVLAGATYVVTTRIVEQNAIDEAKAQQEANMRVAWNVLRQYGDEFRLDGETIYVGDRAINDWYEPVDTVKNLVGGTATVFAGDTRVSTNVMKDDGTRAVGTQLAPSPTYDAVLVRGEPYRGEADILGKPFFTAYDPIKNEAGDVIGVLYVGLSKDALIAQLGDLKRQMAIVVLVVTLIIAALVFVFGNRMFRPVARLGQTMTDIAAGNTGVTVPARGRGDEVGRMAAALEDFRRAAVAKRAAEAEQAQAAAQQKQVLIDLEAALGKLEAGDLSATIRTEFPPAFASLKTSYNAAVASLGELVSAVKQRADAIRTGSQEISAASEDLARRTEANAARIEETSATATQVDQRLRAGAQAASETAQRAERTNRAVDEGRGIADNAVQAMGRVSESAEGIDEVIEGLDKIAFQTRVLAMNAAVEAGRAGEAGRGFAVVADLVSALAMRAEEESKRAREQLTLTRTDIGMAVEAVQRVDGSLATIVDGVGEVNGLLAKLAEDNRMQAGAVSEITATIGSMETSTQQNAAMVEQTSAAANSLLGDVNALADIAARFVVEESDGHSHMRRDSEALLAA